MEPVSVFMSISLNTLIIALTCVVLTVIMLLVDKKSKNAMLNCDGSVSGSGVAASIATMATVTATVTAPKAPSPRAWPIVGNLYSLAGYELPYQSFGALAKKFGNIISLQLGVQPAIVVNGIDNIKEVLIGKSTHFDSRPNFKRYHDLFSGNKENSLAFCDWSVIHQKRRDMLTQHSFPRNFSLRFNQLNEIITDQLDHFIDDIHSEIELNPTKSIEIKPLILQSCANIFTQYFCSRSFSSDDTGFQQMIGNFDKIFYEVNQGYLADFLPVLLPIFHSRNLRQMEKWSHEIRDFILANIIKDRKETWTATSDPCDYVESLVDHVTQNHAPKMEWDTALFALEDIIGGHSAVGNFMVKVFGYLAQNQQVQHGIQAEVDQVLAARRNVESSSSSSSSCRTHIDLNDRNQMPYTEAVIMEALRMIASPIVPHVANQDSTIGGYLVEKDTLIFLNNYDLSMSDELWTEPHLFKPERFLRAGRLVKPDFFLPFGGGRRSCMGYKLVQFISFSMLANLMKKFTVCPEPGAKITVEVGSLALSEKSYKLQFHARDPLAVV